MAAIKIPGSALHGRPVRTERDVTHPVLNNLYSYWISRCGKRRCPARSDLDPVDIPRLLPHIVIVDVGQESSTFRIRLAGTEVVRWNDKEITGTRIEDVQNSEILAIIEEYRQTAINLTPRLSSGPLKNNFGQHKNVQRLLLPLSADGVKANMIIGGIIFDRSLISAPERADYHQSDPDLAMVRSAG